MKRLSLLAYLADALILGTYLLTALSPAHLVWFHLANAIGFVPHVFVEIRTKAYPVIPLTLTFGVLGIVGLITSL